MIWYINTYIIAYVKIKNKIYYPLCHLTAQLLFKIDFQKVDQHAGGIMGLSIASSSYI